MPVRDNLCAAAIRIVVLAGCLPDPSAAWATADQRLLLEVVVNGYDSGKVGEFTLRDGALFATRGELTELGVRVPNAAPATTDGLVALSDLPGVTVRLDQATQAINLTAGDDRLLPTLIRGGAAGAGQIESGTGLTLNYDITGTSTGGQNVGSGLFDMRGFSPWGVMSSGALVYLGANQGGSGSYAAIRLDSTYVYSDPDTMRRYRLGDVITGGLGWTRPVRLGGGQVTSDFSMRPDLVTFPLPSVGSSVAVPSTVDVLVNGTQFLSRQVQPGPFQIAQLPVVTGAGTVAMTVSDAAGRQITTTLPFYASSDLLASGLQTYSFEAGAVRSNFGFLSNDYGNVAAAATWRRGLTDNLTVEAHAEGTAGQFMAGGGLVANLFNLGVADLAAAGSSSGGRAGAQVSIGAQRIGPTFSLGASATFADRSFRDIAAMNGDPVPRRQITANAGASLGRFGSLGIAYVGIDRNSAPTPIKFVAPPGSFSSTSTSLAVGTITVRGTVGTFRPAQQAHILTASYSLQVGTLSFYATGFRDFASGGASGVLFGLTIPLGRRSSASASAGGGSGNYAQAQAVQSAVDVGDWGYQVFGAAGNPTHAFAEVEYKSPWALVSAGADHVNRQTSVRAGVQGALSYVDGGLFASNAINDSFAVVDTAGVGNVRVYDENREVGHTDAAGRLLVPDLRSFDVNHVAIEPTDVPVDATVPYTGRDVKPQDRSGVVVRFPIKTSHGALLRLVDEAGAPIKVGSTATLAATGVTVPVGYDGAAFVEDLTPQNNRVTVQLPDGRRCAATFAYHPATGEIPNIGPLRCQLQQ